MIKFCTPTPVNVRAETSEDVDHQDDPRAKVCPKCGRKGLHYVGLGERASGPSRVVHASRRSGPNGIVQKDLDACHFKSAVEFAALAAIQTEAHEPQPAG